MEKKKTETKEEMVVGGGKFWFWTLKRPRIKCCFRLSQPMILTNVFYYSTPLVSVMFASHLANFSSPEPPLPILGPPSLASLSWSVSSIS
ncbi:hypothetical protein Ddye_026905 [Dipteronia dyeriana]|uniref:Transmembrane protein n=1 Tax=Dipteronia dyeriana TaxID=168575 RepID=A0AAD9TN48_9ROSI|nr:hypothetical protein Ddye_026905 [Dipteronia dyeriana]